MGAGYVVIWFASLTIFAPSAEDGYRDLRDSLRKDDGVKHSTVLYQHCPQGVARVVGCPLSGSGWANGWAVLHFNSIHYNSNQLMFII
jgi:hypothetical protein